MLTTSTIFGPDWALAGNTLQQADDAIGFTKGYKPGTRASLEHVENVLSDRLSRSESATSAQKATDWSQLLRDYVAAEQSSADKQMAFQRESQQEQQRFNAEQAALDRAFQQASADKQMAYAERMSNTQYQRAVADMRKAGINPILLARNFSGSSPQGTAASGAVASSAMAQGSKADISGVLGSYLSSLVSSSNAAANVGATNRRTTSSTVASIVGSLISAVASIAGIYLMTRTPVKTSGRIGF